MITRAKLPRLLSLANFSTTSIKSNVIKDSLWSLKSGPPPALALGAAGLIPFVSAPAYLIQINEFLPLVAQGQLAYGAVILSFLGGVRWGKLATPSSGISPSWKQFTWSVTPSLIAWPALLMPSFPAANLTIVAGLGLCGYMDIHEPGYASWFKGLRIVLTTIATISLLTTLALSFTLKTSEKDMKND